MIIQKQKPFEEILDALKGEERIFITGCSDCATVCKVGGEEEVAEMQRRLEEAGKTVTGSVVMDTACQRGAVRRGVQENQEAFDAADCVLCLHCGTGVQTIGDNHDKPVHGGADSLFIGEVVRAGKYMEKCSACGQCILEYTGGICPVTRCAKGLLNGPCGGYNDGKCEVDPDQDCAWVLIYERLKAQGRLDLLNQYHEPKAQNLRSTPRRHEWPKPKPKKKEASQ